MWCPASFLEGPTEEGAVDKLGVSGTDWILIVRVCGLFPTSPLLWSSRNVGTWATPFRHETCSVTV